MRSASSALTSPRLRQPRLRSLECASRRFNAADENSNSTYEPLSRNSSLRYAALREREICQTRVTLHDVAFGELSLFLRGRSRCVQIAAAQRRYSRMIERHDVGISHGIYTRREAEKSTGAFPVVLSAGLSLRAARCTIKREIYICILPGNLCYNFISVRSRKGRKKFIFSIFLVSKFSKRYFLRVCIATFT